jgi:hypothetical protein
MKYNRPKYLDPSVKIAEYMGSVFTGGGKRIAPVPERPISIRENFRRAYKRQGPMWFPNSMTDFTDEMISNLTGAGEADWSRKDRYDWKDWFDVEWTFVPEAGGPMLKPGTQFMDDVTKWRELVKFPRLEDYDIEGRCKKFLETYDPEKILHINIGLGCTERLVALMGGYTDAMIALAMEPEEVRAFLEAFVDFEIRAIGKLLEYLPIDMITYHDDWGTERDTFFSEAMMEDIVFPPTKRLFDFIHSKDICVEHHCCGNIKRFVPYMIKTGADFVQIQARANDMPAFKKKYGKDIGFNAFVTPKGPGKEAMIEAIRETVDTFGAGGGAYTSITAPTDEEAWDGIMELYYYSREFYDKEQGRG